MCHNQIYGYTNDILLSNPFYSKSGVTICQTEIEWWSGGEEATLSPSKRKYSFAGGWDSLMNLP